MKPLNVRFVRDSKEPQQTNMSYSESTNLHFSRFLTNFSIDDTQWERMGSTITKTTVYDTKEFDLLEDKFDTIKNCH